MHPEQDRRPEEELKDRLRGLKNEIQLRDVKLTNIEWQLRLIAEIMRRKKGSVLDVEMTMLDKQSKGVPIDEQANDDVVHLDRFREADRLTDQAFDPCS